MSRNRNLTHVGAILFYLSRAWTYLYFVPQMLKFGALSADVSMAPDLASDVLKWVNLSWIRCAIDGVAAVLFLRAASAPEDTPPGLRIC